MSFRFTALLALLLAVLPLAARADDYIKATWPDLAHTLVRFNALNLQDQDILDEYAMITDCELYKSFYHDDFKWNTVRQAMLKSMQINIATYPIYYHYDVDLQLDRYDFSANLFRFAAKASLHNVNTFIIYSVEGTGCGEGDVSIIPRIYRVVLPAAIEIDGLPLAAQDAQAVLKNMDQQNNPDRIVYTRINLRIVYIEPLHRIIEREKPGSKKRYQQSSTANAKEVRLDARLDSIDFYQDAERKALIYHYQP